MLGGTTKGFCRREWDLWYGDKPTKAACKIPLSDGQLCGDRGYTGNGKDAFDRCPYNRERGLKVDFSACEVTTYAKKHDRPLATGGAGNLAHDPDGNKL